MNALLQLRFYWGLEHLIRPIIISAEVAVSKFTHPGNNTELIVQSCIDLRCHNLQKWKALAHCVNTFWSLDLRKTNVLITNEKCTVEKY